MESAVVESSLNPSKPTPEFTEIRGKSKSTPKSQTGNLLLEISRIGNQQMNPSPVERDWNLIPTVTPRPLAGMIAGVRHDRLPEYRNRGNSREEDERAEFGFCSNIQISSMSSRGCFFFYL
jgi:hypothetical protein